MILTPENYYSPEADWAYMSYSQYKSFLPEFEGCEAAAMAQLNQTWHPEEKEAFLVGKYVHAWSDGTLDTIPAEHPEMYSSRGKTAGELKANFKQAEAMIEMLQNDPFCMFVLTGEKEIPIVAELFGVQWKAKIDVRNTEHGFISDLKTVKSLNETEWIWDEVDRKNKKISFLEKYGYITQAAIYTDMDRIVSGLGQRRDYLIVAVTKEDPPDHAVISLKDEARMQEELDKIRDNLPRIIAVKNGEVEPERCEKCAYCRETKKLRKAIHYSALVPA